MAESESAFSLSAFVRNPLLQSFTICYMLFQNLITWLFAPNPPKPSSVANGLPQKRVAVIGAGLTGVSAAAHCVGHGFEVEIFEARPKDKGLGGIWSVSR